MTATATSLAAAPVSTAQLARDVVYPLDPRGEDPTVELMAAVLAFVVDERADVVLDELLLERAARAMWPGELPARIQERLGLVDEPIVAGEHVAPTREQHLAVDALALAYDQVVVEHTPTATQPRLFTATCVTRAHVMAIFHVFPSGLRCEV